MTIHEIALEFLQQAQQQPRHQRNLPAPVLSLANRKRLARQGIFVGAPVVREAIAGPVSHVVNESTWNEMRAARRIER